MAHFVPCPKLPDAPATARYYLHHIFRSHGLPVHLVSDRGPQFVSRFWGALHQSLGTQVHLSSAYHPQSDGQTERTNATLEQYLRCYTCYQQDDWAALLPLAEFAYNNAVHSSTQQTPFMANYGRHPRSFPAVLPVTTVPAADGYTRELQEIQELLREQLQRAKDAYKATADKKRQEGPPLRPGDRVWLSTRHLRQSGRSRKLSPRFIGPYPVLEQVNPVAFRLQLPPTMHIHPVFHRSLLVPVAPSDPNRPQQPDPPPPVLIDDEEEFEVRQLLDSRVHRGVLQYLVDWEGYGPEERSWEPADHLHAPDLVARFHADHPDCPAPSVGGESEGGDSVRVLPLTAPVTEGLTDSSPAGELPGPSQAQTAGSDQQAPQLSPPPPRRAMGRLLQQRAARRNRDKLLEGFRHLRSSSPEF